MRRIALLLAALGLAACTNADDLDGAPADLGDFHLGHNIVVAPNLVQGPFSRKATRKEWIAAIEAAVDERFGRYEGTRLYHLGISVDGYVLALPGVPVVAAPKSILILQVTVWDDAAGRKLNDKPQQLTVVESLSGDTVVGSGLTLTREEQMQNLSRNAAKQIETWLIKQKRERGWFEGGPARNAARRASPKPETPAPTSSDEAEGPVPETAAEPAPAPAEAAGQVR